jgi:RNA polymerase sigma-70 factor, ECF subfamily
MTFPRLVQAAPRPLATLGDRGDDELMTLAQAGLREAFAVLVERHAERLVQVCARFVNDGDLGAELAQETWVTLWTQRAKYRGDGRFMLWLITAGRNRCRNHLRRHGVVRRHYESTAHATAHTDGVPSASQIDELLLEERRRRVRDALARLPERMREAVVLRYGEELAYEEMAVALRVGESTLRSRVHHGLRLLRSLLDRNGGRSR